MRRLAVLIVCLIAGALLAAQSSGPRAQTVDFHIDNVSSARKTDAARLAAGTIEFSDRTGPSATSESALTPFDEWAARRPIEKKFLSPFPAYVEPTVNPQDRPGETAQKPYTEKLYMYLAQARFMLPKAPSALGLAHYVTLSFLQKIDPAVKHQLITSAEVPSFQDKAGAGNDNPDRKWCTGMATAICIASTYKLEGKIPIGIMLVNKLRESKKIADHIDFDSEFAAVAPTDLDQNGLQELTGLNTAVSGVLEQNIFYVNQIMKFGKFLAVFQAHPSDPDKTVVTAFMTIAIKASVLDEKRDFEKVPVLRNLVPAQVLMGQSSFNSGESISAGLPKYARNEIKTVASLLRAN